MKEMITYTCPDCGHTWRRVKPTFYTPDPKKRCRAHDMLRSARVHEWTANKLRGQAREILARRAAKRG